MNSYLVLIFISLSVFACEKNKKEHQASNSNIDSSTSISDSTDVLFNSFWGIDSIVKINYAFVDSIDSIYISRHVFEAVYLAAHKGRANIKRFQFLKTSNPAEYEDISNIHTAHILLIGEKEFSFNGKGDINHSETIPESTDVVVNASVYSFFSKTRGLGKFIILDSIKKQNQ